MDKNVSEFEEGMTYYIVLLYLWEMIRKREERAIPDQPATQAAQLSTEAS